MKKFLCALLALLICSGCSIKSGYRENIDSLVLDETLDAYIVSLKKKGQNIHTSYFSYYLPSDMQRMESNQNSVTLTYDDIEILMNLNISSILSGESEKYYTSESGFYDKSYIVYSKEGTYFDLDDQECAYNLGVYSIETSDIVYLYTPDFRYYAFCYVDQVEDVIKHMFILAKNVSCNHETILNDFSSEVVIDYEKKDIDLFAVNAPTNGYLSEMLIGSGEAENGSSNNND